MGQLLSLLTTAIKDFHQTLLALTNNHPLPDNMDAPDREETLARRLQMRQDREYALQLAGLEPDTTDMVEMEADEQLARDLHEEEFRNLLEMTRSTDEDANDQSSPGNEDEIGDTDATIHGPGRVPRNCVACHDSPGIIAVPCEHRYCADCLTQVLQNAMNDGTAFPPRCCRQEIPVAEVRQYLDRNFVQEFENKAVELGTANPLYCHHPQCSTFIPLGLIRGVDNAMCPRCRRGTCTHCKAQSHVGDCQEDEGLQQLLQTADGEGWRRCECGRMIELDTGCNHMTCQCRREFCYLCGERWKTCGCPQWQEERLLHRAAAIVDRGPAHQLVPLLPAPAAVPPAAALAYQVAPPQAGAPVHQGLVQNAAQQLQANAGCQHPKRWGTELARGTVCEVCHRPKNRCHACRHCGIIACYPCRRNRNF